MRIKKDPQLQPFVEYLRADLAREQNVMMGLEVPGVYRAQGRAGYAQDLMKLIADSDVLTLGRSSARISTAGLY